MTAAGAIGRILVLPRYGRRASSSRLRHYVFLEALREAGFDLEVAPFFDDDYLDYLYAGRRPPLSRILGWYRRRARALRDTAAYDAVWVEKELFPFAPLALEQRYWRRTQRSVLDIDDAWFLRYAEHRNPLVRRTMAGKIETLAGQADVATVANQSVADELLAVQPRLSLRLIGPSIDLRRFAPGLSAGNAAGPAVVAWIGTPQTAALYLPLIAGVLDDLQRAWVCRVMLIGAGEALPALAAERHAWSEETEADLLAAADMVVMPLQDGRWERGKSGFKLLQGMALGKPVIASRVGLAQTLVEDGVNGFLVDNISDAWRRGIATLAGDAALRARMGAEGRARVERSYAMADRAREVVALMTEALARPPRHPGGA